METTIVLASQRARGFLTMDAINGTSPQVGRVLIVDDQPANVLLAHRILGGEWNTFVASSGQEALTLCASSSPDLVLLDVNMPGMDGLETCRRLKANPLTAAIPVIFVTVGSTSMDEDACWNAGGSDFVAKPINPTTLRHRVRVHIAFKRQADQLRQLASATS